MLHLGEIYWGGQFICDSLLNFVALIVIVFIWPLLYKMWNLPQNV